MRLKRVPMIATTMINPAATNAGPPGDGPLAETTPPSTGPMANPMQPLSRPYELPGCRSLLVAPPVRARRTRCQKVPKSAKKCQFVPQARSFLVF